MSRSCLAVITARRGSKGVPGKNIRPLAGRPALNYAIDAACACPDISTTVVTTDSPEIRAQAIRSGAEAPFLRPPELATDTAKQEDAILHAMDWYEARGDTFDYVCLLQPTLPLRRAETISRAFERLRSRPGAEGVVSVTECAYSPLFCNTMRPDGSMRDWIEERYKWANRQELPTFFQLSALVMIATWAAFRRERSFVHDACLAMVVDPVEALDIDRPIDWFLAELLLERGIRHSSEVEERLRR